MKRHALNNIFRMDTREKLLIPFLAPAILLLAAITLFPFVYMVKLSLSNFYLLRPNSTRFIGFGNFGRLFADSDFWNACGVTLTFTFVTVLVEFLLGMIVALLLNRELRGKNIFRTILILPMVATPITVAYMWRILYNPELGMLNYMLGKIGIGPFTWLGDVNTALFSVILVDVWQWTPFMVLILLSGLMSLPTEQLEAAYVDGASWWQRFRYVIIPLLKPIIAVCLLLRTIDSLKTFDIIYALTGGGPVRVTETLNLFVYQNAFRFLHVGYASAGGIVLLIISILSAQLLIRGTKLDLAD